MASFQHTRLSKRLIVFCFLVLIFPCENYLFFFRNDGIWLLFTSKSSSSNRMVQECLGEEHFWRDQDHTHTHTHTHTHVGGQPSQAHELSPGLGSERGRR